MNEKMHKNRIVILMVILSTSFISSGIVANAPRFEQYLMPGFEIYFAPEDNCEGHLKTLIQNARYSIHCALFELELDSYSPRVGKSEKSGEGCKNRGR
jgi:hypothetical protein